ncbi:MAG: cadherin repeat domain-containing protein, partial [Candidatus Helarchaeota archaeon]|nr:cadherin repeat domain-containing protein [Candidatus Helarchaeota archaeon]
VKSSDVDEDFVNYTYQWEKNGVILAEERKDILEKGQYKKGDSITVTVIPDDREATGKPKKSEPVVVSNSPPIIISSPMNSVEGMTYIYQVKANDPDDDPIVFSLKSGPPKMVIDKNTGLICWEIRKEDKGSHLIEIESSDGTEARSFQRFTVIVRNERLLLNWDIGILE